MTTDTNNIIRQIRKRAGLTQTEVGNRCGNTQPEIADFESERYGSPLLKTVKKIADACGVSVVYLPPPAGWRILPDDYELPPETDTKGKS